MSAPNPAVVDFDALARRIHAEPLADAGPMHQEAFVNAILCGWLQLLTEKLDRTAAQLINAAADLDEAADTDYLTGTDICDEAKDTATRLRRIARGDLSLALFQAAS